MFTDIFVPTMMRTGSIGNADSFWFRAFVRLRPGADAQTLRDQLYSTYRAFERERTKRFVRLPKGGLDAVASERLVLEPALAGISQMQRDYRSALMALAVLVGLVLLIACANVANLMTAQASSRAREMALRVSIGAGRWRLVQLVLVESALLAFLAAAVGAVFAGWSAPLVVGMINPPDNPARLLLPADWRVVGFGLALALAVTVLFGLPPALRASAVKPASALKGGDDPRSRGRLMHSLIAVQVAFCVVILFVGGLFVATFNRLAHQSTGFSADRLLTLDTIAQQAQPPGFWEDCVDRLQGMPGVEKAALADWPLLSGTMRNYIISMNGGAPLDTLAFSLAISPGWMETMKVPFLEGRDFRRGDAFPSVAIVNQTFSKQFLNGASPIGRFFDILGPGGARTSFEIVGLVGDTRYRNLKESMLPMAYFPIKRVDAKGAFVARRQGTLVVRSSGVNPLAMASLLREELQRGGRGLRVSDMRTQLAINESQTVRERLLARLAWYFEVVALALSGIGIYGVLDYSVLRRRREIGIRMALGARAWHLARAVTTDAVWMVLLGAVAGMLLGVASARYVEALVYQVKATDVAMFALPTIGILATTLVAALPPVLRAVRVDPIITLRTE